MGKRRKGGNLQQVEQNLPEPSPSRTSIGTVRGIEANKPPEAKRPSQRQKQEYVCT
jgi:hypothetical protein